MNCRSRGVEKKKTRPFRGTTDNPGDEHHLSFIRSETSGLRNRLMVRGGQMLHPRFAFALAGS
jgi:hypothetical protein